MNKPESIKIKDFKLGLANLINDSELSFYIIQNIIKDLNEELTYAIKEQEVREEREWQQENSEDKGNYD